MEFGKLCNLRQTGIVHAYQKFSSNRYAKTAKSWLPGWPLLGLNIVESNTLSQSYENMLDSKRNRHVCEM